MNPASILVNFPGIAAARTPQDLCVFFDDFFEYTATDWTITTEEDGTGDASEAITDGVGGLLLITNDNLEDDNDIHECKAEAFKLAAGKPLWFKARVAIDDTGLAEWFIGLTINTGDTIVAGDMVVTDGVYFVGGPTDVAADYLEARCEKGSAEDCTAHVAIVNATYYELAFFFDGVNTVYFYVDGAFIGKTVESDFASSVNIPDTEELAVAFGVCNSSGVIRTMTIDYIFVAQQR